MSTSDPAFAPSSTAFATYRKPVRTQGFGLRTTGGDKAKTGVGILLRQNKGQGGSCRCDAALSFTMQCDVMQRCAVLRDAVRFKTTAENPNKVKGNTLVLPTRAHVSVSTRGKRHAGARQCSTKSPYRERACVRESDRAWDCAHARYRSEVCCELLSCAVPCGGVRRNPMQCFALLCSALLCSLLWSAMICYCLLWFGLLLLCFAPLCSTTPRKKPSRSNIASRALIGRLSCTANT